MVSLDLYPRSSRTSRSLLFLMINETIYGLRVVDCDPGVALKAFRLDKADGACYDVTETVYGPQCDCPDFIFRRDGIDPTGCKHVKALIAQGLIAGGTT